jgi:uncharacterized protein
MFPIEICNRGILCAVILMLAGPVQALIPPTSCGGPPDAPDAAQSDLSVAYWARQEPSMTMCSYGYWAEKCGDHATANAIFDRCIAAGYVGAMIWKAVALENGNGVPRDDAAATALMRRAAMSGDETYGALGKLHYATALYLGRGVERDEAEAMKWFRAAAEDGEPEAITFLATGNHTGERDRQGHSVAAQRAALDIQGQRLAQVSPPEKPAQTPDTWLLLMIAGLLLAGAVARGMPRRAITKAA